VVPATVLAAEPKNVVFVLIDTLRADRLGAYGCTQENISPSIDALAKQSVLFEQPISQAHWTIPSVGAIFTGVYPTVSGQSKKVKVGVPPLPDSLETMAEHFSASGMDTASFVQNNVLGASNGYAQGFDTWRVVRPNAIRSVGSATFMTDLAVDWLDGHRGDPDPFFLYVHDARPVTGRQEVRGPDDVALRRRGGLCR
jgi:arylsulfatase A-like enzyme